MFQSAAGFQTIADHFDEDSFPKVRVSILGSGSVLIGVYFHQERFLALLGMTHLGDLSSRTK